MKTTKITYKLDIGKLIRKNGLDTCLTILPRETRRYLVVEKQYGKEKANV